MNIESKIGEVFNKYNFVSFPKQYNDTLIDVVEMAVSIYGNNLLSVTLGGSGGKNKIIEGWSDLDIYIILKCYDLDQVRIFEDYISRKDIHIGTTIYCKDEVLNKLVDFKTKVMIFEKYNYNVNPTLYGDDYFPEIVYSEIYENDKQNYPVILQAFKRMYIQVLNNKRTINKEYIKKMLVLLKCIFSSRKMFVYGYTDVFDEFYKISGIEILNMESIKLMFSDLEKSSAHIRNVSREILEYIENIKPFQININGEENE